MSDKSKIEWCDATWNPVVGCSKVSAGCKNCYAIPVARRLGANPKTPQYAGLAVLEGTRPNWTGVVRLVEDKLDVPLRWRKPRRIFVNSESDLFHEGLTDSQIDNVFATMAGCGQHTFLVLTKRPQRMLEYLRGLGDAETASDRLSWLTDSDGYPLISDEFQCVVSNAIRGVLSKGDNVGWPMRNLWLGVSVEDQKTADERIPLLLQTPAAVRWISAEPLLRPVDLELAQCSCPSRIPFGCRTRHLLSCMADCRRPEGQRRWRIDWVVSGGESGPGARPLHPLWARFLRAQCSFAGVPFFFKQWGAWAPLSPMYAADNGGEDPEHNGSRPERTISLEPSGIETPEREDGYYEYQPPRGTWLMEHVGKKAAGRLLDGREYSAFPEVRA